MILGDEAAVGSDCFSANTLLLVDSELILTFLRLVGVLKMGFHLRSLRGRSLGYSTSRRIIRVQGVEMRGS